MTIDSKTETAGRTVFLYTEASATAVFARRRGCVRALYYTDKRAALVEPWLSFLKEKNERVERLSEEALLRLHHGATEGLLVETFRPDPKSPSYPEVLADQRENKMLLFVDGLGDVALGELAVHAVPAGFREWILSERQISPGETAYARAAGALEGVRIRRAHSLRHFLKDLRAHFLTIGLSRSAGKALEKLKPPRAPGRPVALVWSAPHSVSLPIELSVHMDDKPESMALLFRILQASHNALE